MQATKIRYSPFLFLFVFYEAIFKGHSFYQISNQFSFNFKIKITKVEYKWTVRNLAKKQRISKTSCFRKPKALSKCQSGAA